MTHESPLVSTTWLKDNIDDISIKVIDCTWHMPAEARDASSEFKGNHIAGAIFMDIDQVCDTSSGLSHTMPSKNTFQAFAQQAGLNNDDTIIIYDNSDISTAARGRFMFRHFGHRKVYILDGGLRKWISEGHSTASNETSPPKGNLTVGKPISHYKLMDDLLCNIGSKVFQVVDARANARFTGSVPEPRAGLRSGHIPGSINVPFPSLLDGNQCYLPQSDLKQIFIDAGFDFSKPAVTSCGSGVTACILALALEILEKHDVAIYDGSWTEWGSNANTPVETG